MRVVSLKDRMTDQERKQRLVALAKELDNLKRSLPAHSLKPAMLIRIEELEDEIETLKREDMKREA